jgi:hypothetical protein
MRAWEQRSLMAALSKLPGNWNNLALSFLIQGARSQRAAKR